MPGTAPPIRVKVLLFAALRERRGEGSVEVELPRGSTAADVVPALFPRGAGAEDPGPLMFAVAARYVPPEHRLADGDEVALIPPLGGG